MFEHEFKRKIDAPYYFFKKNLYINNLTIKKFKYFRIYTKHWRMNPITLKDKLIRFVEDIKVLFSNLNANKEIIFVDKATWVTDTRSNQFFHWLTDSLQRIEMVKKELGNYPIIIHDNYLKDGFIKESLEILEIPFIIFERNKFYKVKNLLITSHVGTAGNYHNEAINKISKTVINSQKIKFPTVNERNKKIWISRQNTNKRKIENFKEVKEILNKYNYEILNYEKLNFKDQIIISNKAKVIGGLHGGGLTNMLFMETGSLIFEIRDENDYFNNCFFTLSSDLNHKYFYFLGKANNKNDFYASDYVIDVKKLDKELKEIEKIIFD